MSGSDYLVLGYVLGLLVLVGYAINLWIASRRLGSRNVKTPPEDKGRLQR